MAETLDAPPVVPANADILKPLTAAPEAVAKPDAKKAEEKKTERRETTGARETLANSQGQSAAEAALARETATPGTGEPKPAETPLKAEGRAMRMLGSITEKAAGFTAGLGAFIETSAPVLTRFFQSMRKSLGAMTPNAKRMLLSFVGGGPIVGMLFNWMRPDVEMNDIHEKLKNSGKTVVKSDKDAEHLANLKLQHKNLINAAKDGTPEKALTFDTFIERRIVEIGKKDVSLEDIVNVKAPAETVKPPEAKSEADKKIDEVFKGVTIEKVTEGLWKLTMDLGGETVTATNPDKATVEFKRNADGTWQWRNNSVERWLTTERFDVEDKEGKLKLTADQKKNRDLLNKAANALGIPTA